MPFYQRLGELPRGSPILLACIAFVHSIFDSASTPAGQAAVAAASPPELVAAGQGLYEATGLVIAATSAAIAAPVYGQWGAAALWCPLAVAIGGFGVLALAGTLGGWGCRGRDRGEAGRRRVEAEFSAGRMAERPGGAARQSIP